MMEARAMPIVIGDLPDDHAGDDSRFDDIKITADVPARDGATIACWRSAR